MTEAEIQRIHAAAQEIRDQNKENYSVTEFSVIVRSQYFELEELFNIGASMTNDELDDRIIIDNAILDLCRKYLKNTKRISSVIIWDGREKETERVESIQSEVEKAKKLHLAIQDYRADPDPAKYMVIKWMMEN